MKMLNNETKQVIKDACTRLTGWKRRAYQAKMTNTYFQGSARKAERELGWGRASVQKGLNETDSGIRHVDQYHARGRLRTEDKIPGLKDDIIALAELHTQADPAMKSALTYTRLTGKSARQALMTEKGYRDEDLPTDNTLGTILNRLGYNLKRVLKSKPRKKVSEVDAIFENVWEVNRRSDENPTSLRLSLDAKAKLAIGPFSRHGKSRGKTARHANDHDMHAKVKLVPYGILEVASGQLTIVFGTSYETSDFIVDCLELWWEHNRARYPYITELVLNLDNGPNSASSRTQFLRRMTEFSDRTRLRIRLAYYPPYHSKYNAIERCWGILEEHWNGEILDTIEKAINWAGTMTWKGIQPVVHLWNNIYAKGVRLTKKEMRPYEERLERSSSLPKWDVVIPPASG
jgi:transposase